MSADITIRRADLTDMSDTLEWRNDQLTRQMFRDDSEVFPDDNEKWFRYAMKDDRRNIFISQFGDDKICMVRFDEFELSRFDVSINMNPNWRGKRLSKRVLADYIEFLRTFKTVELITAEVKNINIASKKIFIASGFVFVREDDEYCVYEKVVVS